jgi:hypothetical protein
MICARIRSQKASSRFKDGLIPDGGEKAIHQPIDPPAAGTASEVPP